MFLFSNVLLKIGENNYTDIEKYLLFSFKTMSVVLLDMTQINIMTMIAVFIWVKIIKFTNLNCKTTSMYYMYKPS